MSVVRRDTYRRWAIVGSAIAVLCALPSLVAALPVHAANLAPGVLRDRILGSSDHPYQGYAQSFGGLDLPDLPQLGDVSSLLGDTTTMRTWFAGPSEWRTDVVTDTGEQDLYQTPDGTVSWDFETGQVTRVIGNPTVRLPRAADLTPPQLGLRLLHGATPADRLVALPARRVAGIGASGLEIQPTETDTTVGRIDIWADPATGVPLEVAVYGRGGSPVIDSRFLDVSLTTPAASAVTFTPAAGLPVSTAYTSDITSLLDARARRPLPAAIDGDPRTPLLEGYGAAVAGYGAGFGTFAVLYLGDQIGDDAITDAKNAGATGYKFADGTGWMIQTPLLTVILARSDQFDRVFLLAGFTNATVLKQSASDLLSYESVRFRPGGVP